MSNETLNPSDLATKRVIVFVANPMDLSDTRTITNTGQSYEELREETGLEHFNLTDNGLEDTFVSEEDEGNVLVDKDYVLCHVMAGGDEGGKNPFLLIVGVILTVATGGLFLAATITAQTALLGIGLGLSLIAAGAVGTPETGTGISGPNLNPATSLQIRQRPLRLGQTFPTGYGEFLCVPSYIAPPYIINLTDYPVAKKNDVAMLDGTLVGKFKGQIRDTSGQILLNIPEDINVNHEFTRVSGEVKFGQMYLNIHDYGSLRVQDTDIDLAGTVLNGLFYTTTIGGVPPAPIIVQGGISGIIIEGTLTQFAHTYTGGFNYPTPPDTAHITQALDGSGQFLHLYMHISVGEREMIYARIGDTDLSDFEGAIVQVLKPEQSITLFNPNIIKSVEIDNWKVKFGTTDYFKVGNSKNAVTSIINNVAGRIFSSDAAGELSVISVPFTIKVLRRNILTKVVQSFDQVNTSLQGDKGSTAYNSIHYTPPAYDPAVDELLVALTRDADFSEESKIQDIITWTALQAAVDIPKGTEADNTTRLAVKIRLNDQTTVSGAQQIHCKFRTIVKDLAGNKVVSRSPVLAALDMLGGANGGGVFEAPNTYRGIHMQSFSEAQALYTGNGLDQHFDGYISQKMLLQKALNLILSPMYTVPINMDGQVTLFRDEYHAFSSTIIGDNLIGSDSLSMSFNTPTDTTNDGLLLSFTNEKTDQQETISIGVHHTEDLTLVNPKEIEIVGITDYNRVMHYGKYLLLDEVLRRALVTVTTELNARSFLPLDRISLQAMIFASGSAGSFDGLSSSVTYAGHAVFLSNVASIRADIGEELVMRVMYNKTEPGHKAGSFTAEIPIEEVIDGKVILKAGATLVKTGTNPITYLTAINVDSKVEEVPVYINVHGWDNTKVVIGKRTEYARDYTVQGISPTSGTKTGLTLTPYVDIISRAADEVLLENGVWTAIGEVTAWDGRNATLQIPLPESADVPSPAQVWTVKIMANDEYPTEAQWTSATTTARVSADKKTIQFADHGIATGGVTTLTNGASVITHPLPMGFKHYYRIKPA